MKKIILGFSLLMSHQSWSAPTIEIGLLLDSSGSMSGLINQTRNKLWKLINALDYARKGGEVPIVKIGLYSYGNGKHVDAVDEIVKISDLTTNHDLLSADFFELKASGGREYAGQVIDQALTDLKWNENADFSSLYLAGNETLKQGKTSIEIAAEHAVSKGVILNTIFAQAFSKPLVAKVPHSRNGRFPQTGFPLPPTHNDPLEDPIFQEWQNAAHLGLGSFHHINQNATEAYIEAPQDKNIIKLNKELNKTYVPYGKYGLSSYDRMVNVDGSSSNAGGSVIVNRGRYKVGQHYNISSWDLVDAYKMGKVKLENLQESDLPQVLKGQTISYIIDYLEDKFHQRTLIKEQIKTQYSLREIYVQKIKAARRDNGNIDTIEEAMVNSLKEQLILKGFNFIN